MRSFFVILHTLFDQTGRRSHIDTYVVSGVERKKEIEVKVAAARLLQKKQDVVVWHIPNIAFQVVDSFKLDTKCLCYDGIESDLNEFSIYDDIGSWANVDDFQWSEAVENRVYGIVTVFSFKRKPMAFGGKREGHLGIGAEEMKSRLGVWSAKPSIGLYDNNSTGSKVSKVDALTTKLGKEGGWVAERLLSKMWQFNQLSMSESICAMFYYQLSRSSRKEVQVHASVFSGTLPEGYRWKDRHGIEKTFCRVANSLAEIGPFGQQNSGRNMDVWPAEIQGFCLKKKVVHETTTTDYKTLQSTLKRIGVNGIPAIEEVNIFKDETVIQFLNELFAKRMSGQKDCLTAQDPHVWRSADLKPGMHGLLADISPKDELTNRLIQHVANIGEQHSSFFGIQNVPVQQIPSQGMTTSSDISRYHFYRYKNRQQQPALNVTTLNEIDENKVLREEKLLPDSLILGNHASVGCIQAWSDIFLIYYYVLNCKDVTKDGLS
ncbi:nascent polypeptide-associated complex subunit beta-like protein [Tanacetum coccineum]|uniref:Nascent polypeptide-associated complex subunit beta-like protein n=1 Tax=Tanacetum coccineum TaxID=301880 RepID=A0ABQ5FRK4_9ASTR